ncbi:unnamed protein product [Rangifer tarandus platyrhynchus]|uniref:Uncharacterized protein n=2 Tax=Rangifer tarandus platyrhynchus TaxID=3082113 RepID=A0ABN8YZ83_RANTA|nr:unnamed protein product [Rangifer tarandus platyrhynchus]CAI9705318.1 unnamed protein product [Rangifer tarandus platyrhynchus]
MEDEQVPDSTNAGEIFDLIRSINDPEHPLTLEELNAVEQVRVPEPWKNYCSALPIWQLLKPNPCQLEPLTRYLVAVTAGSKAAPQSIQRHCRVERGEGGAPEGWTRVPVTLPSDNNILVKGLEAVDPVGLMCHFNACESACKKAPTCCAKCPTSPLDEPASGSGVIFVHLRNGQGTQRRMA